MNREYLTLTKHTKVGHKWATTVHTPGEIELYAFFGKSKLVTKKVDTETKMITAEGTAEFITLVGMQRWDLELHAKPSWINKTMEKGAYEFASMGWFEQVFPKWNALRHQ